MPKTVVSYFGNGPYCYSNATSMLLSSLGEQIPPWYIEPLTGVGLGAFWLPREKLLFFSSISNPPDLGISLALKTLGFEWKEKSSGAAGSPPFEELRRELDSSPAILGPLDMGYLTHNPLHKRMTGADHFVLALSMDDRQLLLHDPEGFPDVSISLSQLERAWRAENIGYRRGYYRYWTRPNRISHPSRSDVYESALRSFKDVYSEAEKLAEKQKWEIDAGAINTFANHLQKVKITPREAGFLVHFAFKLGARRAIDFATFFEERDPELSSLKLKQAELFGRSQVLGTKKDWPLVAETLHQLALVEADFRDTLPTR